MLHVQHNGGPGGGGEGPGDNPGGRHVSHSKKACNHCRSMKKRCRTVNGFDRCARCIKAGQACDFSGTDGRQRTTNSYGQPNGPAQASNNPAGATQPPAPAQDHQDDNAGSTSENDGSLGGQDE
ncbi:hypothetical protein CALCODRAFT_504480 [Calocera cornea HHB12733]|uniref:Zn(2)-C6 fungal-type domain-containing protein n=1 Tax=Calocera cornea HHB12733 TaxID=1353952 RepID=A0A165CDU8_9BASI|nr:hypothetical protein CALCODRAFT_504480 [Calocera cornea HHB12733]